MLALAGKAAWDQWVEQARSADILGIARSLGVNVKKSGTAEWIGPCPVCGGDDRFSINVKKQVSNCRVCGLVKGNVIALVEGITGCGFIEACERINGTPRPDRSRDETLDERNARLTNHAKRQAEYQRREDEYQRIEAAKAKRDEEAIDAILQRAVPLAGTYGEAYLRGRGLTPDRLLTGDIKFVAELDYWGATDNGVRSIVHLATLPAIVARIRDFSHATIGISQTYLDPKEPRKWKPEGSPSNSPKKIRGEKKHGLIRLGRPGETLAIGEGWENCLAWHQLGHGPENVALAAAVDLGNLAGGATGVVPHPSLTDPDGKPVRIVNGVPDPQHLGIIMPEGVKSVILLADLDSETFATAAKLRVAVNRFYSQGYEVDIAWPDHDKDWNDILIMEQGDGRATDTGASL